MSLTRFLRRTQGTRGQIRAAGGFGAVSLVGRGKRQEYVPSIGKGLLLNMPLRKDTRMIYSAGTADGFSTETVDADGTFRARTAIGGLITGATANTARITDDGVLVEPTRTNLLTYSEQFNHGNWAKYRVTATANQAVAPDGQTTADKLVDDGDDGQFLQVLSDLTDNAQYTESVFVKYGDSPDFTLRLLDSDAVAIRAQIDFAFTAGVLSVAAEDVGSGTVKDIGGGWYRAILTCPVDVIVNGNEHYVNIYPTRDGNGASGKYLYAWGAQFELGAAASSYIPTTTGSVERAKDDLRVDNTSEVHCKKESGTIFVAFTPVDFSVGTQYIFSVYDAGAGNGIWLQNSAGKPNFRVYSGTSAQAVLTATDALTNGETVVIAVVWAANDARLYVDGTDEQADTSVTIPAAMPSSIFVGQKQNQANHISGTVGHILSYSDAKSATDIATISAEIAEWMT